VLEKRPPIHNQSAKNTLDIILTRGIIKRNNKNISKEFFHTICTKIQYVRNEVRDISVYCTSTARI
jgi:hypothetical protein